MRRAARVLLIGCLAACASGRPGEPLRGQVGTLSFQVQEHTEVGRDVALRANGEGG